MQTDKINKTDVAGSPVWSTLRPPLVKDGKYKEKAADFRVEEVLSFEPSDDGEHCLLLIEKEGANTQWVARELSKVTQVKRNAVGYAGLKDRHAITQQWFSVQLPGKKNPASVDIEGCRVVDMRRHNKKIKQGAISANQFSIKLQQIDAPVEQVEQRLQQIATQGVPNYFGKQRFGQQGANINAAVAMLESGRRVPRDKASIYLSALRAWFFNQYLQQRLLEQSWLTPIEGDQINLSGSRSVFSFEPTQLDTSERIASGDCHVAGPLPGDDWRKLIATQQHTFCERIWQPYLQQLNELRVATHWRALRVVPQQLSWQWLSTRQLTLEFTLPSGSFATAVLRELGEFNEPNRYASAR